MFNLETGRLQIRSLTEADLPAVHAIFEHSFSDGSQVNNPQALAERASWLQWTILSDQWYAKLHQPPYGDKAIVLKSSQEVVGLVGFVPCLDRFEQLPIFQTGPGDSGYNTPAVGLFWAVHPAHQQKGYASEAAGAMIQFAFNQLNLKQIVATTEYENVASQAVMKKVGLSLHHNPRPEPPWLQVVGVCGHP